jgi:hypothetical protein
MLPYAGRLAGLDAGQAFFEWMPTAGGNRLACLDLRSGDWAWEIEPGAPVMQLADVDADRVISTEGYRVSCRRVVMRLRRSGEAGWTWTAPERETVCYVDVCGAAQARWLQVITQPARGEAPSGFACRAYRLNLETGEPQRSTEIPRLDPHLALRLRRGWPARIDEAVWPLVTAADKLGRSWSLHVYAKRDERRLARYTLPAYGGMPYGLAETHLCGGRLLVALDKGLVAFVGQAPDRGSPPAPDR